LVSHWTAQSVASESFAAIGAVDELEAFADAAEDHRMFADEVCGTEGAESDLIVHSVAARALQLFMPICGLA
jgi:hypothetical protein